MTINAKELAQALAMVMDDNAKKAFMKMMESGNIEAAKRSIKSQAQKHVTEQMIIGSHALTSPAMQSGISEISYGLLKNETRLSIDKSGCVIEVAIP